MQDNQIKQYPQLLWFLQISFVAVILLANWFDIRFIRVGGLETDAGTLIFPLTFIISDLITEVYGYKYARRAIWAGFLFNFIFIVYGQIVTHLPSPAYAVAGNQSFDSLMGLNVRIIIASTISYFCSEPLNSYIMARLKIKTNGRMTYLRFVLSTLVASFFDSFIFGTLAFYGTMPNQDLIKFNATMWLVKVAVEIIGLPLSLSATKWLKKYEQLDMYDIGTKFSIFSLDASYTKNNNKYRQ
jgi:queuosine precursor transporter